MAPIPPLLVPALGLQVLDGLLKKPNLRLLDGGGLGGAIEEGSPFLHAACLLGKHHLGIEEPVRVVDHLLDDRVDFFIGVEGRLEETVIRVHGGESHQAPPLIRLMVLVNPKVLPTDPLELVNDGLLWWRVQAGQLPGVSVLGNGDLFSPNLLQPVVSDDRRLESRQVPPNAYHPVVERSKALRHLLRLRNRDLGRWHLLHQS